ncbi:MAG: dihydrofolate reductase [Acidimicrobiia bacterium]|nr:dihydrofolate reductase family protein [Acidimicrobiia bacterium]NNF63962.1 dihydrofolate reductase [Acidimicrobiia bacterium]
MRLVVTDFMSLDGVVQAPGGPEEDTDGGFAHGGWSMPVFDVEVMGAAIAKGMETTDALLFGRRTWQAMAGAWPERAGDPYADQMNAIDKYVVSRSLTEDDMSAWKNSTLLSNSDPASAVAELKERDGRDLLVWGSAALVRTLVTADLVDVYQLMIAPLLLGGGKRIFPDDGIARSLKLESLEQASTGVLIATYTKA